MERISILVCLLCFDSDKSDHLILSVLLVSSVFGSYLCLQDLHRGPNIVVVFSVSITSTSVCYEFQNITNQQKCLLYLISL